jgi:hypothetical protein
MTRKFLQNQGSQCREDDPWDVFVADEDECDPEPEPGDFWPDDDLPFIDVDLDETHASALLREVLPCSR